MTTETEAPQIGDYVRYLDHDDPRYREGNHIGEVVGPHVGSPLWDVRRLHGPRAGEIWSAYPRNLVKIGHPDKIEIGDTISCARWADYNNSVVLTLDPNKVGENGIGLTARRPDGTVWTGSTGFNHIIRKWDDTEPTPTEGTPNMSTPEFSAELVVAKVFEYAGCDDGKYDWLATVGLGREAVEAIRSPEPKRLYRAGDIVRKDDGRLWIVRALQTGRDSRYIEVFTTRGTEAHEVHVGNVELVQETSSSVPASPAHNTPDFTKEKVIREAFNTAHGGQERTREQRVEWLASVGITEAEVDEVIPTVRLYKEGDFVKCIGRLSETRSFSDIKLDKLYAILEDQVVGTTRVVIHDEHGSHGVKDAGHFELVQAVDA